MQPLQTERKRESHLKFVFDDAVVSCGLAVDATGEDIARTLGDLAPMHFGNPVAIYLTLGLRRRQ
jgi:hypothetical protein